MPQKNYLTRQQDITVSVREQDFVTVFGNNWQALMDIMGISRPIRKTPGTKLVASKASITLESTVGEGEEIPFSRATVEPVLFSDVTIEKYAKSVSIEAVNKFGAAVAIQKTDEAFLNELQNKVLTRFYTFLNSGELTYTATTFQMALAMAKAQVVNKFQKMRKTVTEVVGFCNILDAYNYLGSATVSIQNRFGVSYIQDFMGYRVLFLLSDPDIPQNTIIAVPVDNIDCYYVDPGDSDFAAMGLNYTTQGVTNLIGFHAEGDYTRATGNVYALLGMTLWAEYIDGIAVVTVEASGSLGSVTGFSTAAYSAGSAGDSILTVPDPTVSGGKYYYKEANGTAPSAPTYLAQFDTTGWTEVVDDQVVSGHNSYKYRVVEVNGAGQAIASADGTVTAKT